MIRTTLLLFAVSALCGCRSGTEIPVSAPTPYLDKAQEAFASVWSMYRVPEYGLFSEYYPDSYKPDIAYFNDGTKKALECSYLWPMSGVFSSAVYLAKIDKKHYGPYLDSMVVAVEMYRDDERMPTGYQAYPVRFGKVDRYYDDNGLVGIDYIDSYAVTRNPLYLERAKHVMAFILSGWRNDHEGAVSWLEGVYDQKPACANGKAMVLALKLYEATQDPYYLVAGQRFYDWMDKYLHDTEKNIVWNSLLTSPEVKIDSVFYSYNTGLLIEGAVALYRFTKDQRYLDNARALAQGSYRFFMNGGHPDPANRDAPWFYLVLMRGYHDLYDVDGDPKYVSAMIGWLGRVWEYARDRYGLFYSDWSGQKDEYDTPKWLLDEACMAEFYARAAVIQGEVKLNQ